MAGPLGTGVFSERRVNGEYVCLGCPWVDARAAPGRVRVDRAEWTQVRHGRHPRREVAVRGRMRYVKDPAI